jgi:DGQHR domain-containing protein
VAIDIIAFRVNQFPDEYPMYVFKCKIGDLLSFTEVIPSSRTHPNFPQRPLNEKRAREIASYFSKGQPVSPAILLNFDPTNPPAESALSGVDKSFDLVRLSVDPLGAKAYCMDGQHRLKAFDPKVHQGQLQVDIADKELSVVAFLGIDLTKMTEQFITINTTQEKVRREQILTTKGHQKDLEWQNQWAFDVIRKLNEIGSSPLKGQVAFFPADKKTILKNVRLMQIVKNNCESLRLKSPAQAAEHIANYLAAWTEQYGKAWKDPKQHMIQTAIGIEMLMSTFAVVDFKRQAKHGQATSKASFASVISPCAKADFKLPQIGYSGKPISWLKQDFKVMAAGKHNTEALRSAFHAMVVEALKK